jgi:type I restriction enzyme S subunit
MEEVRFFTYKIQEDENSLLLSLYDRLIAGVAHRSMGEVCPLVRRPVEVDLGESYPELGIRSFGNGTFHKPALTGSEVGSKHLYRIEPGDLVFSNVFAWEGAIAVAQLADAGRVGSHRFITCVPKRGIATADFLCFHFLTPGGIEVIRKASPGGAGRNRTLGLEALARIKVPIPPFDRQNWFDNVQAKVREDRLCRAERDELSNALMPSVLDKAFRGEP